MTAPKPIPQVPAALCGLYPGASTRVARSRGETHGRTSSFHVSPDTGEGRAIVEFAGETMDTCLSGVFLLLDSPLAMCHAARWLAARWLIDLGATAPQWYTTNYVWVLRSATASGVMWNTSFGRHDWAHVKVDIDESTDPAAALAAACMALAPT